MRPIKTGKRHKGYIVYKRGDGTKYCMVKGKRLSLTKMRNVSPARGYNSKGRKVGRKIGNGCRKMKGTFQGHSVYKDKRGFRFFYQRSGRTNRRVRVYIGSKVANRMKKKTSRKGRKRRTSRTPRVQKTMELHKGHTVYMDPVKGKFFYQRSKKGKTNKQGLKRKFRVYLGSSRARNVKPSRWRRGLTIGPKVPR
jgi:hypothetical protein